MKPSAGAPDAPPRPGPTGGSAAGPGVQAAGEACGGEREAGAGQAPPRPAERAVPFNPFIPARWWRCEPPGREPPASRSGRRRAGSAAQMSAGGSREPIPTGTTSTAAAAGGGWGWPPGTRASRMNPRPSEPPRPPRRRAPEPPYPRSRGRPRRLPAGHGLQPPLSPGLPGGPRARRGAAPGAVPWLPSRRSAARAPKSGNYANARDVLPFDLNFLGTIPSHYGA